MSDKESSSTEPRQVLITGITGYLATQVAITFLEAGYAVRGTVRSQAKAEAWETLFPQYAKSGKLEFAIVEDMVIPGAFDESTKGCSALIHCASPFTMDIKDRRKEMLDPAVRGAIEVLESASKELSVKHVAITGSFAAIHDETKGNWVGKTYTEADWNPATLEDAMKTSDMHYVYCASKKLSEKAVWEYVDKKSPHYSVTVLIPSAIFGPPLQPMSSMSDVNTSVNIIWRLISGSEKTVGPRPVLFWVDVRDVALAHLRAIEKSAAKNQRYLLIAGDFSTQQIAYYLRHEFPENAERIPQCENTPPPPHYGYDCSKAETDLDISFRSFKESVRDTAVCLWKREKELTGTGDV